jgi:hypothetical protein
MSLAKHHFIEKLQNSSKVIQLSNGICGRDFVANLGISLAIPSIIFRYYQQNQ